MVKTIKVIHRSEKLHLSDQTVELKMTKAREALDEEGPQDRKEVSLKKKFLSLKKEQEASLQAKSPGETQPL